MRRSLRESLLWMTTATIVVALGWTSVAHATGQWKKMRCSATAAISVNPDGTINWGPGAGTSTNPQGACGAKQNPQCTSPTTCQVDTRYWVLNRNGTPGQGSVLACNCVQLGGVGGNVVIMQPDIPPGAS